jgi:hypothetical protein
MAETRGRGRGGGGGSRGGMSIETRIRGGMVEKGVSMYIGADKRGGRVESLGGGGVLAVLERMRKRQKQTDTEARTTNK